jgi:hypothetical protein
MWLRNRKRNSPDMLRHRRALRFEQFELRQLMAVTTSLAGGILTVTGDTAADNLAIVGTTNPGELTITGRNGTVVNGVPDGSTTIPGVSSHLRINLGDGNNVVAIDNAYLAGGMDIISGEGADLITLGEFQPVSPANSLFIDTGDGDNIVRLGVTRYSVFLAGASIHLGAGNDQAALYGASSTGNISIAAAAGDDSLYAYGVTVSQGGLALLAEAGNNSLAAIASFARFGISMRGWDGANSFYVQDCYTTSGLFVIGHIEGDTPNTRPSSSVITISGCLLDSAQIVGTRGHDAMTIVANSVSAAFPQASPRNSMTIEGVGGDDNVQMHYNLILENLFARLGEGNDFLWLNGNDIRVRAELDGQAGSNALRLSGNLIATLATNNFTLV